MDASFPRISRGDSATASTVVAFAPEASFGSTFVALVPTSLGLLALVLLVSFAVAALIAERYLPAMQALHRGLMRLRERRFETIPPLAIAEFAPLEREFNITSLYLQR